MQVDRTALVPEEVAGTCAFFTGEEAGYITAQTLGANVGCFTCERRLS